jgi:acetyl-CoA C-acetyltransferase
MALSAVYVAGGAMTPFNRRRDCSTPRDWVRQVAAAALLDARIDAREVDAVVFASETDFLSLQLVAAPLLVDEIGLAPAATVRVETGGASGGQAVRAGLMHLLSGLHRTVLVVGFEHAASHLSGDDVRMLYGLSFDADLEGFNGVTATALYALSIQDHIARHGTTPSPDGGGVGEEPSQRDEATRTRTNRWTSLSPTCWPRRSSVRRTTCSTAA